MVNSYKGKFDKLFFEDIELIVKIIPRKLDRCRIRFNKENLLNCINDESSNTRKLGIKIAGNFLHTNYIKAHYYTFNQPRLKNLNDYKKLIKKYMKKVN